MLNQEMLLERVLLEDGLCDKEQLDAARRYAVDQKIDLVEALVQTKVLNRRQIALAKVDICEVPFVDLSEYDTCYANTELIRRDVAERHSAFPLQLAGTEPDRRISGRLDNPNRRFDRHCL